MIYYTIRREKKIQQIEFYIYFPARKPEARESARLTVRPRYDIIASNI